MNNPPTVSHEIQSDLEGIEKNAALYEEANFDGRSQAIDAIEFNILDRIEGLLESIQPSRELIALKGQAEIAKRRLEDVDENLFQRLRADLRAGRLKGTALKQLVDKYVRRDADSRRKLDETGYDNLDIFINGLLLSRALPDETLTRELEMSYYQQTPVRIIFDLVEKARLTADDVFYDLGSGLGQVPVLANLFSGARARGVEFEPAYYQYARLCAEEFNLPRVEFINADARAADYTDGTVFFLYTPFVGKVLHDVLEKVRSDTQHTGIRLFSYGACTPQVSRHAWLEHLDQNGILENRLAQYQTR